MVEVKVGSEADQESFFIHEIHLQRESGFFRAAMSHAWKEAKTGVITLPEEDPDIFAIFLGWLYTGKLSVEAVYGPQEPEEKAQVGLSITVLGDKLDMKAFHDQGINFIMKSLEEVLPSAELVRQAYDNIPHQAPVCNLLQYVTVNRLNSPPLATQFFGNINHYPHKFGQRCFYRYLHRTRRASIRLPEDPSLFYMERT